jgi:ABC-type uncharacterized transport system substrate-binding protein
VRLHDSPVFSVNLIGQAREYYSIATDPVTAGFVDSLARPGGNITVLATLAPEISGKQLELLKEVIPKLSRVAVLGNIRNAGSICGIN